MILSCFFLASLLSAGNSEFDRQAAEGAARITMERFVRDMRSNGLTKGVLSGEMLSEPGRFVSREKAEKECRAVYNSKIEEAFARKFQEVREKLSLDESFVFEFSSADRAALEAKFPETFRRERREAVASQAERIASAIRPSETEIDEKNEDVLRAEMTHRVAQEQNSPVFEENMSYISKKIVVPVIESAKQERRRQGEYILSRARTDAFAPSRLEIDLKERLELNVRQHRKDMEAKDAWGIFPSVLSKILPQAVERRTMNRFLSSMKEIRLEVDADKVARFIAANPSVHVKYSDSEKVFLMQYARQVLEKGLSDAVALAPLEEREEYRSFLSARLNSPDVLKSADKIVRREIMPIWKRARAEIAERMVKKVWPSLDDGTWYPEPYLADDTLSRSDYKSAVHRWRDMAGLENLASAPGDAPILEESSRKADERVFAAFELARNAIAAQNEIVDACHNAVLAEAKAREAAFFSKTPNLGEVVSMLMETVRSKWAETRMKTLWPNGAEPSNAEEQHTALFPSVKAKIELLARKILEEIEKPESSEREAQETPEQSENGQGDEIKLEYSISVLKTSSGVEVKLIKGDSAVFERTVDSKFAPFDSAMREVSRKLGKELMSLP